MAEEKKETPQETAPVEEPKGRAAALAAYKGANPDITDDPDDDSLFDYMSNTSKGHAAERDDYKGKYDGLISKNQPLIDFAGGDERNAHFLSLVSNGVSPKVAFRKAYGKFNDELDDDEIAKIDEEEVGYTNSLKENFKKFIDDFNAVVKEREISDEQADEYFDLIRNVMDNMSRGNMPKEAIETFLDGITKDEDEQAAFEAGKVAGGNDAIAQTRRRQTGSTVDMGTGGSGTAVAPKKTTQQPIIPKETKGIDFLGDSEKVG